MITVPSNLFYSSTLQPFADPSVTHSLVGLPCLPNPDIPMLFVGVEGVDDCVIEVGGNAMVDRIFGGENGSEGGVKPDLPNGEQQVSNSPKNQGKKRKSTPASGGGSSGGGGDAASVGLATAASSSLSGNAASTTSGWFNSIEASKLVDIVQQILREANDGPGGDMGLRRRIVLSDIGVMAPYREQVKRIRQLFRSKGMRGVDVGTVEDYQGQERKIILISTVRSRRRFLSEDVARDLGLVYFPKRLNVALTRAKAMLVIVGNPHLLVHDPHWLAVLSFFYSRGLYRGCTPPLRVSAVGMGLDVGSSGGDGKRGAKVRELDSGMIEDVDIASAAQMLERVLNLSALDDTLTDTTRLLHVQQQPQQRQPPLDPLDPASMAIKRNEGGPGQLNLGDMSAMSGHPISVLLQTQTTQTPQSMPPALPPPHLQNFLAQGVATSMLPTHPSAAPATMWYTPHQHAAPTGIVPPPGPFSMMVQHPALHQSLDQMWAPTSFVGPRPPLLSTMMPPYTASLQIQQRHQMMYGGAATAGVVGGTGVFDPASLPAFQQMQVPITGTSSTGGIGGGGDGLWIQQQQQMQMQQYQMGFPPLSGQHSNNGGVRP
ncbi:hypothetical protein HK102_002201 [Quaeritorhiza haematococci]|nr:hypothetical protein HK102_002201 [Quaeritorhiza haematococci]